MSGIGTTHTVMKNRIKKNIFLIALVAISIAFYYQFFLFGRLPIPSDALVGLYHPYRDFYSQEYPRGLPYKNFLITDPVRQTYVWKQLSMSLFSKGELPIWNPYEMGGKPLAANFQSSVFYPLNILLLAFPFDKAWSVFILLQTVLGGVFMYMYLRSLKLEERASLLGSLAFSFSGFFVAWLEWGTIAQTALWLPLILLTIEKLFSKEKIAGKNGLLYSGTLGILFSVSLFAGHLQTFFYMVVLAISYAVFLGVRKVKKLFYFLLGGAFAVLLTIVQWYPTMQFIQLSGRGVDQNYKTIEGWFFPYIHLIQFIAPDFFGNPSTLNYWGTWNYGELIGYIGVIPLIFVLFATVSGLSRRGYFFFATLLISILFAGKNIVSELPFLFNIPLIATAQPTRLLFVSCFSLSVLCAFGFNAFITKKKRIVIPLLITLGTIALVFVFLWTLVVSGNVEIFKDAINTNTAKRNLLLPSGLFGSAALLLIVSLVTKKKVILYSLTVLLLGMTIIDLFRVSYKFEAFTSSAYLFPSTKALTFLQSQQGQFRITSLDKRILPPNFATYYRLQSAEGYDPLYLQSYAQYVASLERGKADITEPFGFNRIISPQNYNSKLFDMLNIKYVLTINPVESDKLKLVFSEGETKVYENLTVSQRYYCAQTIETGNSKNEVLQKLYSTTGTGAVVSQDDFKAFDLKNNYVEGSVEQVKYSENKVILQSDNPSVCYLVFGDVNYPKWHAEIDGKAQPIINTNFLFRGLVVPSGKHTITFYAKLL